MAPGLTCFNTQALRRRMRSWFASTIRWRRELVQAGVDYQIRETVEAAYLMGAAGFRSLGVADFDVEQAVADIRRRDANRLAERVHGDSMSGMSHLHVAPVSEPNGSRYPEEDGPGSGRSPRCITLHQRMDSPISPVAYG